MTRTRTVRVSKGSPRSLVIDTKGYTKKPNKF
jgi:hypothetical protein